MEKNSTAYIIEHLNNKLPEWSFDQVIDPELQENFRYYAFLPNLDKQYRIQIEVDKIKGSSHHSYNQSDWYSMLNNLHRPRYQNIDWLVSFITNEDIIEKKVLHKYGDNYYISVGNHRCCYAKFIGLKTIVCDVIEHIFDYEVYNLVSELKNLNLSSEVNNHNREDWTIRIGEMEVRIKNIKNVHDFIDTYITIKQTYWNIFRGILISRPADYQGILFFENKKGDRDQLLKGKLAESAQRLKSLLVTPIVIVWSWFIRRESSY